MIKKGYIFSSLWPIILGISLLLLSVGVKADAEIDANTPLLEVAGGNLDDAIYTGDMKTSNYASVQNGIITLEAINPDKLEQANASSNSTSALSPEQYYPATPIVDLPSSILAKQKALSDYIATAEYPAQYYSDKPKNLPVISAAHYSTKISSHVQLNQGYSGWGLSLLLFIIAGSLLAVLRPKRINQNSRIRSTLINTDSSPDIINGMRTSAKEIADFAKLMAMETSGQVDGPWKDYINSILAKSSDIQMIIKRIQTQSESENNKSMTESVASMRSALEDILGSVEHLRHETHINELPQNRIYTENIMTGAREILEMTREHD